MSTNKSLTNIKIPYLIDLTPLGSNEIGFLTAVEFPAIVPFEIKRVYWTYLTPQDVERGRHAHKELEQFIVAVAGKIEFDLESRDGKFLKYTLDNPAKALYIPKGYWRTIRFTSDAVLLCLASLKYDKDDYIRDYNEFKNAI
ncbi:MAG: FdtA/QdtA family cupin domain-containing protein [Bacteroidetes bacterium]|nr:FdtA/QdtA family cupin domain-containing protein [Bacteroidota bacterium]